MYKVLIGPFPSPVLPDRRADFCLLKEAAGELQVLYGDMFDDALPVAARRKEIKRLRFVAECLNGDLPKEYRALLLEDLGFEDRSPLRKLAATPLFPRGGSYERVGSFSPSGRVEGYW